MYIYKLGNITERLYVEGTHESSASGDVKLELRYEYPDGTTIYSDKIVLTVLIV